MNILRLRALRLLLPLLGLSSELCLAQLPARSPKPDDNVKSVEVLPDNRVIFSIYAPKASEVKVSGDFLLGAPPAQLTKNDAGIWSFTSPPVPPDSYTYNFNVDGVNTLDTRSATFKENPNALFNYFDMDRPETAFMALKNVPHGRVEKVLYHSRSLDAERRLHVYLPPGFEKLRGKLPVLYLLHGGGDNDISWTSAGKANLVLDNLYAEGKLKSMIVVMPSGHTAKQGNSMGTGPDQDPFCTDLLQDIIPFVEKTYPVSTKLEHRAIAGFSMGGIQTLNTALWHPELFGYVCPMGTGFFPASIKELEEKQSAVLKNPAINQLKLLLIGRGKDDTLTAKNNQAMLELFDRAGVKYQYQELPGGHSFVFTRRYLAFVAPKLFR